MDAKKIPKLPRNSFFRIDEETGQEVLMPLDYDEMKKNMNRPNKTKIGSAKKNVNSSCSKPGYNGNGLNKKTRNEIVSTDMFEIDPETGKQVLRRLDFNAMRASIAHLGSPKPKLAQKGRNFTYSNDIGNKRVSKHTFESEVQPSKLRRIDPVPHSVRKDLFSSVLNYPSANKKVSSSIRNMSKQAAVNGTSQKSSPLLNMEEVEDELITKRAVLNGYPFKSPTGYNTNFSKLTNSRSKSKILQVPKVILEECEGEIDNNVTVDTEAKMVTPNSSDEFTRFEAMCVEKQSASPITALSNLMHTTGLNSVKRTKLNFNANLDSKNCLNEIHQLIKDEETRHEQTMLKLNKLLTTMKNLFPEQSKIREKSPVKSSRRSIRLQNKSPAKLTKEKLIFTSPALLKSEGLLRSTLKKNLAARNTENSSPRTRKAAELYKKTIQNSFLETPKTDRKVLIQTPNSACARLKKQCLLIQDTPIRH